MTKLTLLSEIMKEDNKNFSVWYENLLPHEKRFFKKQCIMACEISSVTFHKWISGDIEIKNPYREMINKIAGTKLFDTLLISISLTQCQSSQNTAPTV